MIKNEYNKKILKMMESCVSHGDYYSIKELSNLELEVIKNNEKKSKREIRKYSKNIKKYKKAVKKKIDEKYLPQLASNYSKYILNKIEHAKNLTELQSQAISFEEFIKLM